MFGGFKMKMVKSLLLGSAAGVVALAGAQAADLPVKAAPVQYVKICSLYGVGFYYIPGTDMCIKVGGWIRAQYDYGMNGSTTFGPFRGNVNDRTTANSVWRTRGYITIDARNQTPYGTVRGYLDVGFSSTQTNGDQGLVLNANRGFIQWAGFTFGEATSFYDFYSVAATSFLPAWPSSTTGGGGWMVAGYTAQLGNGFSATIAIEQPRTTEIIGQGAAPGAVQAGTLNLAINPGLAAAGAGAVLGANGYGGFQAPDVVGNLRVDQAWGSAQVMGAWHQVNTTYYASSGAFTGLGAGHPGDESGWALGAGLKLNAPMFGPGDYFQSQVNYTEGAALYAYALQRFTHYYRDGDTAGYGIMSDAVYGGTVAAGNNTGLNLTTAWNVNAAFEHHWNAQWRTSIYGGYAEITYNGEANAILCSLEGFGNGTGVGSTAVAAAGCDNDWSTWWVGSRTKWNVTKDFYMGVDVLYSSLQSASATNNFLPTAPTNGAARSLFVGDQDALSVEFRVHKDFYP
jgi:hypothetical protein